jgi:hypothetical protein
MRRFYIASCLLLFADLAMAAAVPSPPPLLPPPPPPQSQPPEPACIDARDSADYVPEADAYGRRVAPADLPGSATDVQISTEVYVQMRSKNPQVQGVGVVANLSGLQKPPPCVNREPRSSVTVH